MVSVIFEPPRISCRDCGAEVPEASLDTAVLESDVAGPPDDAGASYAVRMRRPGACTSCGGGRVEIRVRFDLASVR